MTADFALRFHRIWDSPSQYHSKVRTMVRSQFGDFTILGPQLLTTFFSSPEGREIPLTSHRNDWDESTRYCRRNNCGLLAEGAFDEEFLRSLIDAKSLFERTELFDK
jgi:hypothetical protein